jgi:cellulose synthase/poly-beta-1,6-N-acetylglucosamine synthase-like glycosyltransferase
LPVDAATCLLGISDRNPSLIARFEEIDYLHHGILVESVAASFGSVFCVSGTQTFVRLSTFLEVCDQFFASQAARSGTLYRYWQCVLGDDRWLTQLLLMQTDGKSVLQLETRVLNETRSAGGFWALLSQRRRWLLACTSADVFANMSWQMLVQHFNWWAYRILSQTVRMSDIHGLLLAVLLLGLDDRNLSRLGVLSFLVFVGNWSLLSLISKQKGRSTMFLYPLFHVCLPFFNILVRLYAMSTLQKRTWGGARVGADLE